MVDYQNLYLMLKRYKSQLYSDYCITDDSPATAKEIKHYIDDLRKPRCHLNCIMEKNKYFMITQDQILRTYVVDLYVAPEFRRQGIASRLIKSIEGPVCLECYDANPAKYLYYKLGFKQVNWQSETGVHWYFKYCY